MSYQATVFKVMIASPGDVSAERKVIREVIAEWNNVNADVRRTVLLAIGWETHSAPEMGDRAQAIINKRILADCDLLVGVFWTRLGTATGDYASGTVEEIEEHLRAGKPAMLYFSNQPVEQGSVDQGQYQRLLEFRSSCQSRGLLEFYSDLSEFREKLYRQLQITLNSHEYFTTAAISEVLPLAATPPSVSLSKEGAVLLTEAAAADGQIIYLHMLDGPLVQVGQENYAGDGDARSQARWEGAVDELEHLGLIAAQGSKREIFKVTRDGFDVADQIADASGSVGHSSGG